MELNLFSIFLLIPTLTHFTVFWIYLRGQMEPPAAITPSLLLPWPGGPCTSVSVAGGPDVARHTAQVMSIARRSVARDWASSVNLGEFSERAGLLHSRGSRPGVYVCLRVSSVCAGHR